MKRLGFDPEWRKLNAADYGDATTRSRFILMARSDGRRTAWPMPTHTKRPDDGLALFPTVKPWKPAREIIDWDIKGRSIFNRKKPLAPKTLARIYAGAVKYAWPEPYLVILRNHMAAQSVDQPIPTVAAGGLHIGLAEPVIINGRKGNQAQPVSIAPVPTLDTKGGVWLAEPLVLSQHTSGAPRTASDPLPTITTGGAGSEVRPGCARPMLIEPFVLSQASGGAPRTVAEPIPTQTTGGNGASHAIIAAYYGIGGAANTRSDADPLLPITTKDRMSLIVPVTNKNGGATARSTEMPVPTMTTAKGGEFAVVMPVRPPRYLLSKRMAWSAGEQVRKAFCATAMQRRFCLSVVQMLTAGFCGILPATLCLPRGWTLSALLWNRAMCVPMTSHGAVRTMD